VDKLTKPTLVACWHDFFNQLNQYNQLMKTQTTLLEAVLELHRELREFSLQPDRSGEAQIAELEARNQQLQDHLDGVVETNRDLQEQVEDLKVSLDQTACDREELHTIADAYFKEIEKLKHDFLLETEQLKREKIQLQSYYKAATEAAEHWQDQSKTMSQELDLIKVENTPPSGYKSWQQAAMEERQRRVDFQAQLNQVANELTTLKAALKQVLG
jgi:chromosome segregation ATPase